MVLDSALSVLFAVVVVVEVEVEEEELVSAGD